MGDTICVCIGGVFAWFAYSALETIQVSSTKWSRKIDDSNNL